MHTLSTMDRKSKPYAYRRGCQVETRTGHAWGVLICASCPQIWIWSTPRDADTQGRQIRRAIEKCLGKDETNG